MVWKKFKTMGTEMEIVLPRATDESLLDEAEKIVNNFDREFSRFRNDNELYRLNHAGGKTVIAGSMLREMLLAAKRFYHETSGIFDPTVLGSLEAIGYNRSFEMIGPNEPVDIKPDLEKIKKAHSRRPRLDDVTVIGDHITAPAGFSFDSGGLGKGYIVDYLSRRLFTAITDYWLSAGGDMILKGNRPDTNGWEVAVEDPYAPERDIFKLHTGGGTIAVATSGIIKRQGVYGGFLWHHIIDPRSGLPARNDILSVTVISSDALRADIYAKTVLILGPQDGMKFIAKKPDSACAIFRRGRKIDFSGRFKNYLVDD